MGGGGKTGTGPKWRLAEERRTLLWDSSKSYVWSSEGEAIGAAISSWQSTRALAKPISRQSLQGVSRTNGNNYGGGKQDHRISEQGIRYLKLSMQRAKRVGHKALLGGGKREGSLKSRRELNEGTEQEGRFWGAFRTGENGFSK